MSDVVSLSKLGLRAAAGVACPAGGQHEVPKQAVVVSASRRGGYATCLKCGERVSLVAK